MSKISLAVKYRPKTWEDVTEQSSTVQILKYQLSTGTIKNAYLFTGSAGTGKTTCARIFANEINKGIGNPIEMDAASHSSVDDVREIINQAQTKSLDSEYKVFIIDEAHSLSNTAWQAFLKLLEEPPAKSIFIFATTDPQKIPKTILSRVQRYDFKRISLDGIINRLDYIMTQEYPTYIPPVKSLEYLAKIAQGGMRDAITLLDKCLSYSEELTMKNVVKAIGTVNYDVMFDLTESIIENDTKNMFTIIEDIHNSGKDLKQFIKSYTNFVLDLCKYGILGTFDLIDIPNTYDKRVSKYNDHAYENFSRLLTVLVKLNADIKWESNCKPVVEATLLLRCMEID